ncbi:MAG TPA: ribonuclease H-like domain-containing protein [Candidatus Acidoferrales bacterium]|nr:ribonuclease H-like domain-containing protein [Candidatus Acidoferrales bacterium]
MKILFFDIETIPTPAAVAQNGLDSAQPRLDEQEIIKKLSLSALTARVLCIAYAAEPPRDSPVEILSGDEAEILKSFWQVAAEANLFVGHNLLDFDLRFIYQRSIINQVRPSRDIGFARYRSAPVFDTMHEWSRWGREHVKLDDLAQALDLPSPKSGCDGSKVFEFYRAGREAEICEYCKRDVETVRQIYRRMTFTA